MRRLTLWSLVALQAACASVPAPTTELVRARDAVARAQAAGAADYAPVDYKMAREGLDDGRELISTREHELARQELQKAEVRAELATAKSNAARLRAEVQAKETENANLRRELLGEGQLP